MPAARDQLLRLREKLDLANAAAPELDVEPFDRDFAVALVSMDLPLHRVDVRDLREVHVFSPDERRQSLQKSSPAAISPAQGRALIIAERSQFWPRCS